MRQRHLSTDGLTCSALGLGCMGFSQAYGPADDDESIATIRHALEVGVSLLDTAMSYGAGHNEQLIGRAITGRREQVVLATKFGIVRGQDGVRLDGRPEHVRGYCEASLSRLGVDTIDLYYLHRIDPAVPLEDSWGALAEQVDAGKVRALGLSEVSVEEAALAHAVHPVAAVQSELSLWTRDALGDGTTADGHPAGDVVGWCGENGAIFVPFAPLGRGFLTGALDTARLPDTDMRVALPRFTGEAAASNTRIVDAVRGVAAGHGTTAAAVALAWVLARGEHVIPIPGTTKTHRLAENLSAADLRLTPEDLATLDSLPAPEGTRY